MIHPVFSAVHRRPDLFVEHARNYSELIRAEMSAIGSAFATRVMGAVVALVAMLLAIGLSTTAVMLGFLDRFHWALIAVPGTAWLLALVGAVVAMRFAVKSKVQEVRDEVAVDVRMLRLMKETDDV